MNTFSGLELVMVAWGMVTILLIGLAIHRSIRGFREDDRIFIESEGQLLQNEQAATLRSIARIDPWLVRLAWLSGALLLLAAGIWLYPGVSQLF